MTYKLDNNDIPLTESFRSPPSLYRGAPFWSWNGDLKKDELLRQIDVFAAMGIGGYHIHSRTGLTTTYLGDEFMDMVKACRDYGRDKNMLTWLYDEDRWPSGSAGGLVTKNKRYRERHLLFTCTPYGEGDGEYEASLSAIGKREENGELLATYAIRLENGFLDDYRLIRNGSEIKDGEVCWYAYLEVGGSRPWFNGESYVDTLNPEAIAAFIEITHERYKHVVGDSFGTDIPAIFTDEPQFTHKRSLSIANSREDALFPWTHDLDAAFAQQFGESVLAHLPEVIWDLPNNAPSLWRYRYHEWVAERFAQSFADQIGRWCQANNIALTGHMMGEARLSHQTSSLGDCMRSYRSMQIPGIDMLCNNVELNTAKQAQSATRQYGYPGVLSELYGVTGWDYDFKGHKAQGDWQAALGVVFRVHHLSWYCMRGEAKRDYPASISYQSPWYKEYSVIEDHFARVGTVLSRGKAVCKVGVVHPVESYWLVAGPTDTSGQLQDAREENFANMTSWLLQGMIDFDFISESLLPQQSSHVSATAFGVGEMSYEVVIVPGMLTMRTTTLERLESFADNGGRVLFAGEIPSLVDAQLSNRVKALAERCERIPLERVPLLYALNPHRDVDFVNSRGMRPKNLIYQMRREDSEQYIFICNTDRNTEGGSLTGALKVRGEFEVTAMNTDDGSQMPVAARYESGKTIVDTQIPDTGHLLLRLTPGQRLTGASLRLPTLTETGRLASPASITLDEPNVLLFEKAQFSINGSEWQPETQLLDIENILRGELDMAPKSGQIVQPWADNSPLIERARITLRIEFESNVTATGTQLGLENSDESTVLFDGSPVDMTPTGYFTDTCISTIALPDFTAGRHTIDVEITFTKETSIEWMYLLGDFGVIINANHGVITDPVRLLNFGDWTTQGLPFYGGNVTYHIEAPAEGTTIQVPQYKGTTIRVSSLGETRSFYRQPYTADIPMKAGHMLEITVFGHRANCFGNVHLAAPISWLGPQSWRTSGTKWSPEYQLKPLGLMTAPRLLKNTSE